MPIGIYKRRKIPWNKKIVSKNILEELYDKRKLSSVQCGKLLDCSYKIVLARLREYGLHIRTFSEAKIGVSYPTRKIQIDEKRLKKLYMDEKLNTVKCGKIFDCSYMTIRRRLINLNILIRKSDTEFKKGQRPEGGFNTRFKNGKDHPFWKNGITSLSNLIRHGLEYKNWRDKIYRKDSFTCQICNKYCEKGNIIAHPKKSFTDYPELRFDVDNGITLCRGCHLKIHRGEEKTNGYGAKIYAYASKVY